MMQSPWLSVVLPVYNGERYLAAALESVLSQSDESIETLVSDDGSSDASIAITRSLSDGDRIRLIEGPRKGNWVANSNFAVRQARGQFVSFLHQDDLWLPGRVRSIRAAVSRSPSRSLWLGPSRFVDTAGEFAGTWRLPFRASTTSVEPTDFLERLLVQNFVAMPAPVFARTSFDSMGGMDENLWYSADWDLWLKLGGISGVGLWPDATTGFRIHGQSQTMVGASLSESMKSQCEAVRSRYLSRIVDPDVRDAVDRAGRFSCELNARLANAIGRRAIHWRGLATGMIGLGLGGAYRFARDARILERSFARLRAGLASRSSAG